MSIRPRPLDEKERASVAELPALIAKLFGDLVRFLEERLALAQEELHQEVVRLRSAGIGLVVALVLAFMAFGLLTAGLLLLLATVLQVPFWLLLLICGAVYLAVAIALAVRFARAFESPAQAFRASLGEFEKDKEWAEKR